MERYAKPLSQIRIENADQVELCRIFINNDRLSSTTSQISPFTKTKVKKGTIEYDKTLDNCDYVMKKEYIEKSKTSKVSDKMGTILSLVGSKMNQSERRNLLSAIPVSGVADRIKKNLEVERNRELLKLPLFQKYNSPYPDGIAFKKMETEVLPAEAYPIFLKYMKKGIPIPREIEDLFDNPPDPKFYSKLLRIAIQQKIKIGEHLLSIITNSRVDYDQFIQYYINVLGRPILEDTILESLIKNPLVLLEHQVIKNDHVFDSLMSKLNKLNPKFLKLLLERYANDSKKLLIIYFTLMRLGDLSKAENIESVLETKLKLKDLESFIEYSRSDEVNKLLVLLYIKLLGKAEASDINEEVLLLMIDNIEDLELKMDLLKLYQKIANQLDVQLLARIFVDLKTTDDIKKYEFLKTIFEMMHEESELEEFMEYLNYEDIETYDVIDLIRGYEEDEQSLPDFVRKYFGF